MEQYCYWLDWISEEEKIYLLNRCKALIIPSLWEGFGLPALEAMACGTTVLASNKGAIKEILGDNGLFLTGSTYSIANAMYEVANNNYLENKFKFGPRRASEYSWSDAAKKIEEIITNLKKFIYLKSFFHKRKGMRFYFSKI